MYGNRLDRCRQRLNHLRDPSTATSSGPAPPGSAPSAFPTRTSTTPPATTKCHSTEGLRSRIGSLPFEIGFYRAGVLHKAADRFQVWNRKRKAQWLSRYRRRIRASRLLFVGPGGGNRSWENLVEHAAAQEADFTIWCGIEHRAHFPNYVQCDGRALPFRDRSFDLVFSNAVVEHVGDRTDQLRFVAEHARAGRHWALTTPNRWFPLEPHTRRAFLHWLPQWRRRRPEFTRLLSRSELAALLPTPAQIRGSFLSPTFIASSLPSTDV